MSNPEHLLQIANQLESLLDHLVLHSHGWVIPFKAGYRIMDEPGVIDIQNIDGLISNEGALKVMGYMLQGAGIRFCNGRRWHCSVCTDSQGNGTVILSRPDAAGHIEGMGWPPLALLGAICEMLGAPPKPPAQEEVKPTD